VLATLAGAATHASHRAAISAIVTEIGQPSLIRALGNIVRLRAELHRCHGHFEALRLIRIIHHKHYRCTVVWLLHHHVRLPATVVAEQRLGPGQSIR